VEPFTVDQVSVASEPTVSESPVPTSGVIEPVAESEGNVLSLHNLHQSPHVLPHEENSEDVNDDSQVPQATSTTGLVPDPHLDVEDSMQSNKPVAATNQTLPTKHPVGPTQVIPQRGLPIKHAAPPNAPTNAQRRPSMKHPVSPDPPTEPQRRAQIKHTVGPKIRQTLQLQEVL
jgi:hypothetical protein